MAGTTGDDDPVVVHRGRGDGGRPGYATEAVGDGLMVGHSHLGQAHAAVMALEEPDRQPALQAGDGAADRRLRGVKLLGRTAEAVQASGALERAKRPHRGKRATG